MRMYNPYILRPDMGRPLGPWYQPNVAPELNSIHPAKYLFCPDIALSSQSNKTAFDLHG